MEHKFICCSDTHGMPPPPMDETGVTAWLHGGDFYDRIRKYSNILAPRVPELRKWYKARQVPVHMVHGNHDCQDPEGVFGECETDGLVQQVAPDLFVAGIGWSGENFYDLPTERDLKNVCIQLLRQATVKIANGQHSILVTHYPPAIAGVYPGLEHGYEGWMFDCVREVIEAMKPLAVVNGHIHQFFGQAALWQGTLLVHPGQVPGFLRVDTATAKATFEFGTY